MFGRWRRVKATADEMADTFAGTISLISNDLVSDLLGSRKISVGLKGRENPSFETECLVFIWFLVDYAIRRHFGPHADAIRNNLWKPLSGPLIEHGIPLDQFKELFRCAQTRFSEYHQALGEIPEAEDLLPFASVVWRRIVAQDTRDLRGALRLISYMAGTVEAVERTARKYRVVN